MADKFDPYREYLVLEKETDWKNIDPVPDERAELEERLHATAEQATELEYVRLHTGFGRRIIVSPEDLERLKS